MVVQLIQMKTNKKTLKKINRKKINKKKNKKKRLKLKNNDFNNYIFIKINLGNKII